MLPLPQTAGCLVCGRGNPHGLHLDFSVDPVTGEVRVDFTPEPHHIGFTGIAHGGVLATVFDEAMVWAATWLHKRFCYCGEMTVRFRKPAAVGEVLHVRAAIAASRSRLITTTATMTNAAGQRIAEASGKYTPMSDDQNRAVQGTLVSDARTLTALDHLRRA